MEIIRPFLPSSMHLLICWFTVQDPWWNIFCSLTSISSISAIYYQGEANLKFIFFVMQQLDQSIPSISSVKHFLLPGMSSPKQVDKNYAFFGTNTTCIWLLCSVLLQLESLLMSIQARRFWRCAWATQILQRRWPDIPLFHKTVFGMYHALLVLQH